ncbi:MULTISPECIES: GNAT family N-acetyltransferase [unclassified Flavobacterium]|uniref:GNAT family N-acetyltransferase n=1 Tax=unclassified Flavobacterium TaxID=196869 RepID=UPI001F13B472|nr:MULTISPECIES: GNAT family protein [unclassified Flavobacterium]UMY64386.1 GNAT family N-acetyltransferase [Flavobacterium sp. HJ-32-4]
MIPRDLVLENEKVLLRPLEASDFELLLPFALEEPEIWYFSLVRAAGADGLRHYMDIALKARETGQEFPFIVFDKVTGRYAGSTRFYDINLPFATVQLGYTWYGSAFQGTHVNRNCKYLLLRYAFEEWGMERVEFRADARNARSIAAMKSIGCQVDGVLRANMPTADGGRRDSIVLSILKDEWQERVKSLLENKIKLL